LICTNAHLLVVSAADVHMTVWCVCMLLVRSDRCRP
jgi:hypothetical protein